MNLRRAPIGQERWGWEFVQPSAPPHTGTPSIRPSTPNPPATAYATQIPWPAGHSLPYPSEGTEA